MLGGNLQPQVSPAITREWLTLCSALVTNISWILYFMNCMSCSTLDDKIGFVLDDFDQMGATVRVLSRFQVGGAKLRCSVGRGN